MANTDLQQRNETPYFAPTADVNTNTDPYLVPTDGKIVSAQSNGTDEAPILPVLLTIRGTLAGLRGAIVGDVTGADKKTVYSLYADGAGGVTHTKTAGHIVAQQELRAINGDVVSQLGDIVSLAGNAIIDQDIDATNGNITAIAGDFIATVGAFLAESATGLLKLGAAAGQRVLLDNVKHAWLGTGTGAADANPPRATSIKNQLRAKNTVKVSGVVLKEAGTITVTEGVGGWSAAVVDRGAGPVERYVLRITMVDAMDNTSFQVVLGCETKDGELNLPKVVRDTITTSTFDIALWIVAGTPLNLTTAPDWGVAFHVIGQQTT